MSNTHKVPVGGNLFQVAKSVLGEETSLGDREAFVQDLMTINGFDDEFMSFEEETEIKIPERISNEAYMAALGAIEPTEAPGGNEESHSVVNEESIVIHDVVDMDFEVAPTDEMLFYISLNELAKDENSKDFKRYIEFLREINSKKLDHAEIDQQLADAYDRQMFDPHLYFAMKTILPSFTGMITKGVEDYDISDVLKNADMDDVSFTQDELFALKTVAAFDKIFPNEKLQSLSERLKDRRDEVIKTLGKGVKNYGFQVAMAAVAIGSGTLVSYGVTRIGLEIFKRAARTRPFQELQEKIGSTLSDVLVKMGYNHESVRNRLEPIKTLMARTFGPAAQYNKVAAVGIAAVAAVGGTLLMEPELFDKAAEGLRSVNYNLSDDLFIGSSDSIEDAQAVLADIASNDLVEGLEAVVPAPDAVATEALTTSVEQGSIGGDIPIAQDVLSVIVTKGQSLWEIAELNLTDDASPQVIANYVNAICDANDIADANDISEGAQLKLPVFDGTTQAAVAGDVSWLASAAPSVQASIGADVVEGLSATGDPVATALQSGNVDGAKDLLSQTGSVTLSEYFASITAIPGQVWEATFGDMADHVTGKASSVDIETTVSSTMYFDGHDM